MYLFTIEFFSKTFSIFQVRRIRSMAVPDSCFDPFYWKSVVRSFLNLLTPVIQPFALNWGKSSWEKNEIDVSKLRQYYYYFTAYSL